jgi:hypothetical protein
MSKKALPDRAVGHGGSARPEDYSVAPCWTRLNLGNQSWSAGT